MIRVRNDGAGCPYCSREIISADDSLKGANPSLSKKWKTVKWRMTVSGVTPHS